MRRQRQITAKRGRRSFERRCFSRRKSTPCTMNYLSGTGPFLRMPTRLNGTSGRMIGYDERCTRTSDQGTSADIKKRGRPYRTPPRLLRVLHRTGRQLKQIVGWPTVAVGAKVG